MGTGEECGGGGGRVERLTLVGKGVKVLPHSKEERSHRKPYTGEQINSFY